MFTDDTAMSAVGPNMEITRESKEIRDKIYSWTKKWKIRLNELKSVYNNSFHKPKGV